MKPIGIFRAQYANPVFERFSAMTAFASFFRRSESLYKNKQKYFLSAFFFFFVEKGLNIFHFITIL